MKFGEPFRVSSGKLKELWERIARLAIRVEDIEESFVRGSGKGGSKRARTSNAVQLCYPPMGIVARADRERSQSVNRFLALRSLADRVEERLTGTSPRLEEAARARKQKDRRARRRRA